MRGEGRGEGREVDGVSEPFWGERIGGKEGEQAGQTDHTGLIGRWDGGCENTLTRVVIRLEQTFIRYPLD